MSRGISPKNITEMISVAEESNTLDTVLVSAAEGLEKDTMRRLEMMVKLVEPLMLLVMAGIVLFRCCGVVNASDQNGSGNGLTGLAIH